MDEPTPHYVQERKHLIRAAAQEIMEWEPKGYQMVMELFLEILGQRPTLFESAEKKAS
jgi:hypothetical protein